MGERLRQYRESIPKTLDELARETGIPKSSLGYYETTAQSIREDIQERLKAYGAPVAWIISGEGPGPAVAGRAAVVEDGDVAYAVGHAGYAQGLPREARDAIQKAVQMVESFISVVPAEKRLEDSTKKGLYVMLVADLLVAGRQEEIPDTMKGLIQAFSRPPEKP